jgi:TatD DNase family protein
MAGLHPSSVMEETVKSELHLVEQQLASGKYYAVGEIGIDLYWDKTFHGGSAGSFRQQLRWAKS